METNEEILRPLLGSYTWDVKRGYGSYLTLEFGEPHRKIREPITGISVNSQTVKKLLARRRIFIVGDWTLWIQNVHWTIVTPAGACTSDEPYSKIDEILTQLNGQKLDSISTNNFAEIELHFDLGAKLRLGPSMSPEDGASTIWMLTTYEIGNICRLTDGSVVSGSEQDPL